MNKTLLFAVLLATNLLCACGPKHTEEKSQGILTDTQKQTQDKARQTEQLLDKANKERMKEVDDALNEK